jgi:hypothetical protein
MRKTQINKKVLNLPDDHKFSAKNVLNWIKTQQEIAKQARSAARMHTGVKFLQSKSKALNAETYIREMRRYLRTGLWVNGTSDKILYGEYEDQWAEGGCFEVP